jgi:hypothetical protein
VYHEGGLGYSWSDAVGSAVTIAGDVYGSAPGPSAPATPEYSAPSWWEAPLEQVAQAGADWVESEISGVPTYGGAPAYPAGTPGYQFYDVPDSLAAAPVPLQAGFAGGASALLLVGGGLLAAKLLGFI